MTIPIPESIRPKTIYQVYIEWDNKDNEKGLAVHRAIDKLKRPGDLWHTDQLGGACWTAYIQIQGSHYGQVKEFSEKVLRLMKRYGCDLYALDVGS